MRPERMFRNGRPIVPTFASGEPLYYRCSAKDVLGERLLPPAVHIPSCSVNRGGAGFGPPEDVLVGYPGQGIARFVADDMPAAQQMDGFTFSFHVVHEPDDDNYAHSEIRTHKDGAFKKNWRNKRQLVHLQIALAEKASVIRAPRAD